MRIISPVPNKNYKISQELINEESPNSTPQNKEASFENAAKESFSDIDDFFKITSIP